MKKMQAALQAVVVLIAAQSFIISHAQSGLMTRPINLTCMAPDSAQASLVVVNSVASEETLSRSAQGREAGVVYRGINAPMLQGFYLYVSSGQLVADLPSQKGHGTQAIELGDFIPHAIVEGDDNEIYLTDIQGQVRQLKQDDPLPSAAPATLLSQTGCFEVADVTVPTSGLIPYQPAAPLWSDGATKRRWIAMPDWLEANTQITLLPDGDFDFPNGTILIKEFALGSRLVETRLLVRNMDDSWSGYSYEWNEAQTDAVFIELPKTETINGQEWDFPVGFECTYCHSGAANRSLGLEIAQLNNEYLYVDSGITANQLTTFDSIGLIAGGLPGAVMDLDSLPSYDDLTAGLDVRARGYLHSNCSNCHRPGGPGQGPEDFRYQLDGSEIGASDVEPWLGNLGVDGAKLLIRGNPELSILSIRMKSLAFFRMPPLASNVVDTEGVELIDDWINSGLGFGIPDSDGDIKADDLDNCSQLANPDQRDTNGDGFGNLCDADLSNDGIVNFIDLSIFSGVFLTADDDADFNGDGTVNFIDLSILASSFLSEPGPSGLVP